ncbi:protein kinase [Paenibacillus sp. CF384]|uniref:serine/threonine protein kinase n=1 Tax=Paenibacillus sp. CF384 TaxID=1884382 RepID=UPI0008959B54|nr:protein kinase [Paenibacillus sp. CF384]SDX35391.1 serine/threonine protein kinase [Paenibacillus sp. CF384]
MLGAWWRERRLNWLDYPLREGAVWAGRYRIEQLLGMGSYGQAYRCTDLRSGASVLMKRGKPSKRSLARKMLKRESETLRELHHPQIPQWLDYAAHGREMVLVMELIVGYSLEHAVLGTERRYSQQEALRLIRLLLRPLRYMHEAGYIHRDVRIPNVLVSGDKLVIIDVGLACRIGEESAYDKDEPIGFADSWGAVKHRMRVPEPASDLYGLGHLFLFLMYAGYLPHEGQEELGWEEELELDPVVQDFVRGLLENRWQTAEGCELELERTFKVLEGLECKE